MKLTLSANYGACASAQLKQMGPTVTTWGEGEGDCSEVAENLGVGWGKGEVGSEAPSPTMSLKVSKAPNC